MALEADEHPFTAFNKGDGLVGAPTLVGNWQEERALQELTSVTRYETWVKTDEPSTIYAERQDNATDMPTHPRVIEHTRTETHPADWRSLYATTFTDPKSGGHLLETKALSSLGPRERREYLAMLEEAKQLPPETLYSLEGHPVPPTLASTYRAGFPGQDVTGVQVGARVMRDRDGRPAVRDPTFLSETKIMEKHVVDRLVPGADKAGATLTTVLPDPDQPITIYTEAVATAKYTCKFQGTRTLKTTSPFAKDTNFSKPIGEYSKVVIDE